MNPKYFLMVKWESLCWLDFRVARIWLPKALQVKCLEFHLHDSGEWDGWGICMIVGWVFSCAGGSAVSDHCLNKGMQVGKGWEILCRNMEERRSNLKWSAKETLSGVWPSPQLLTQKQTHNTAGMKITTLFEITQASTTRHDSCASYHPLVCNQFSNRETELTQILKRDVEIGLKRACIHMVKA